MELISDERNDNIFEIFKSICDAHQTNYDPSNLKTVFYGTTKKIFKPDSCIKYTNLLNQPDEVVARIIYNAFSQDTLAQEIKAHIKSNTNNSFDVKRLSTIFKNTNTEKEQNKCANFCRKKKSDTNIKKTYSEIISELYSLFEDKFEDTYEAVYWEKHLEALELIYNHESLEDIFLKLKNINREFAEFNLSKLSFDYNTNNKVPSIFLMHRYIQFANSIIIEVIKRFYVLGYKNNTRSLLNSLFNVVSNCYVSNSALLDLNPSKQDIFKLVYIGYYEYQYKTYEYSIESLKLNIDNNDTQDIKMNFDECIDEYIDTIIDVIMDKKTLFMRYRIFSVSAIADLFKDYYNARNKLAEEIQTNETLSLDFKVTNLDTDKFINAIKQIATIKDLRTIKTHLKNIDAYMKSEPTLWRFYIKEPDSELLSHFEKNALFEIIFCTLKSKIFDPDLAKGSSAKTILAKFAKRTQEKYKSKINPREIEFLFLIFERVFFDMQWNYRHTQFMQKLQIVLEKCYY